VTFTDGPVRLVAASLARVRPAAHEIVVAVDERVPSEELGVLQAVADRVVRAEFSPPLEANLAWLHSLATGDWVLRLDSDDLVSEALVRTLRTPGWDAGITHAYLQYRWLVDGGTRALDQAPWWPDPVLRLIRNDPGLVRFPTGAHQIAEVAGASRLWDDALYHLDLVLRSEEERAAKATGYERANPGLRTDRGWSVSTAYYLPERLSSPPKTAPLPAVDEAVVAQVLQAARSTVAAPKVDLASLGPVVRLGDRRAPAPTPGDAAVRILAHDPVPVVGGRSAIVTAGITNLSGRTWLPSDEPAEVVGGRFTDAHGEALGFEVRAPLPGPVPSGAETLVRVPLPASLPADAVRLRVGIVQDGVAWHDASAAIGLRRTRGRRVLVSTGISATPHLGDDLITRELLVGLARHLPDVVPVLLAHPAEGIAERFGCEVATSPIAYAPASPRRGEPGRRSRDLVVQARMVARGEAPEDPLAAAALEPFVDASALILAPGGGLASRYRDEALLVFAVEALIARAFDLPVLIEAPSVGPIEMRRDQAALGQLLNEAARITVRDRGSADAARRIGRAVEPEVVADIATAALPPSGTDLAVVRTWLDERNVPADRAYAVISLRGGSGDARRLATLRAAVEALPEHTALIYLPHCVGDPADDDLRLLDDEWAGAHLVPFDAELGPGPAVALVHGALIAIGTRFHLSVLAAASGVPSVGLADDEYDRLRLRGLRDAPGMHRVDLDAPATAADAVRAALAADRPEPTARWDARHFAEALDAVLPPAPTLS
jgi:polysaccharide pyruvyl transferase WcaK-like protein